MAADRAGGLRERRIVVRRHVDHDVLARGRSVAGYAHFDMDARQIGSLPTDLFQDHAASAAFVIIFQFNLDLANVVDGHTALVVQRVLLLARCGIDIFKPIDGLDNSLDAHDDVTLFVGGEITARRHQNIGHLRVGVDEEFDPAIEHGEQADDDDHHAQRAQDHPARTLRDAFGEMRIPARNTRNRAPVARFRCFDGRLVRWVRWGPLAQHAAQHREKYQRDEHRGAEDDDQSDGEIAHEFSGHVGPEKHGEECADHRCGRADDRPEHAPRGFRKSGFRRYAFGHLPVGIFDHDNRAVDQNADCKQHREHNHEIERHSHRIEDEKADQERRRYGCADEQARPQTERCDDDDHHENDGKYDRIGQRSEGVVNVRRTVGQIFDMDACGPGFLGLGDQVADPQIVIDDVGADAFGHFQCDRRLTIQAGVARRVVKRTMDLGDITQCYSGRAGRSDR